MATAAGRATVSAAGRYFCRNVSYIHRHNDRRIGRSCLYLAVVFDFCVILWDMGETMKEIDWLELWRELTKKAPSQVGYAG